ncbi:unnamed protein product [Rotaria socialis]|uniref:Uncharacterized protein n=2 Tax=Rotaria socialis TaxID=392032 RepID=A0A818NWW9_9BILA|nr:unnamed protein product [Rotaria socialis]CAF3614062.1 unnamed protein product [Rotaria socialis]CAF3626457.1 unnamed protein product [Rotaria socialis]CAF3644207.1 unnamed protein product [Rotaria socialis]
MCDLFQANPWKPLLCTNCHQNRSGHEKFTSNETKCEHLQSEKKPALPSSSSSMHLYEEIMAQYFTINTTDVNTLQSTSVIDRIPTPIENEIDDDEDSFSDEEQDFNKTSAIEFVQNQSMISTQGIVLIGPDIRAKPSPVKKQKRIHLLKKSKSNADECLKKTDIIDNNNTSRLWWFRTKKANPSPVVQNESINDLNKSNISSPILNSQNHQPRIRVLPEMNKLTLSEALSIARRQHALPGREKKLTINTKPYNIPPVLNGQSNYGSSIASTTSSSTHSSNEYDSNLVNNLTTSEPTYLTAVSPIEKNPSQVTIFDKTIKLTIERITHDLRIVIDEYKHNLPVARFQTLKSFLYQHQLSKTASNESIYVLLLQILDEFSHDSTQTMTTFDHFLIVSHSTMPIIVTTTSTVINEQESIEQFIKNLAAKLFDSSSLPIFNDLVTFENISYRYLSNQIFQFSNTDIDNNNLSTQRIKLLNLFWNKIQSLRHIQINEENERWIFALYFLMKHISQSDNLI